MKKFINLSTNPKILFTIIIVFPLLAHAAVYKHVDEEGRLIKFSDQPQKPGDKPLDMPKPAMEYKSEAPPKKAKPQRKTNQPVRKEKERKEKKSVIAYTAVAIMKPENNEAIRANSGSFPIEVVSQPTLDNRSGHRYVIMVDGEKHTQNTSNKFNLENMERGEHSISVEIWDREGNSMASSSSTTIYVLRASRR